MNQNESFISKMYTQHHGRLVNYIVGIINKREDAENLAQDVWVRVLTSDREMQSETVVSYLFTIAGNLCRDYLRRVYCQRGYMEEAMYTVQDKASTTPETEMFADELSRMEYRRVEGLPAQRRAIYIKSRFEEKPVDDIACEMRLSKRTVENHLRMGRRDIRDFLAAIA